MRIFFALGFSAALIVGCGATASTNVPTQLPTQQQTHGQTPEQTAAATIRETSIPTEPSTIAPTVVPTSPPTPPAVSWPSGITAHAAGSDGTGLGYLEYLPPSYQDGDATAPLLVYLHGAGGGGAGSEPELQRLLLEGGIPNMLVDGTWPEELPFVVLVPQYSQYDADHKCEFGDDLDVFLNDVVESYRIDKALIYLTGISCGAIGIWDYLATTEQSVAAAVVPISGHPNWAMEKAGCVIAATPTWAFFGGLDDIIPVDWFKERVDQLRDCEDPPASEVKLTIYPDSGHEEKTWNSTYDRSAGNDIYSWLLEHELQSD